MMEDVRIQIIIPTRNNAALLERTMESILCQDYNRELIYIIIMDFGSSDGTYEKALSYDGYHLGVYRNDQTVNQRQMVAEMARIAEYTRPEGCLLFHMVLYPGDVLYPKCLKRCSEAIRSNQNCVPNMIIGEADIRRMDGSIIKQGRLFSQDTLLDGNLDLLEYIDRGYCHQVFCLSTELATSRYRSSGEMNEQRWWNKCIRSNIEKNAIYLSETLACIQEIIYEDELEEILLRWESVIVQKRFYESKYQKAMKPEFEQCAKTNLANYAVWRSFIQYLGHGDKIKMEDCLMIASVIDNKIVEGDHYKILKELLSSNDIESEQYLKDYFIEHGYY